MKIEKKKEHIVEIKEEVKIPQGEHEIILEKGDKIEILKEARYPISWNDQVDFRDEVYEALDDAGLSVMLEYSEYEGEEVVNVRFKGKNFELGLFQVR
jgi:hypothetical protein